MMLDFVTCTSVGVISLLTNVLLVVKHVFNTESNQILSASWERVFLTHRFFFPEIHVAFIDCVGDQPDLKLGSHFERVALGITTARSCVLVRGARDGFAAAALKPSPCLGHCLGEKTFPSTPSLWPAWRSFACTAALEGKHGGYQGYGKWRLDPFRESSPGA